MNAPPGLSNRSPNCAACSGIGPKILEKMRPFMIVLPAAVLSMPTSYNKPRMSESLSGTIERVTFHNPDNGFVVLRVQVKGRRGLATVVGQAASAVAGEYLEATGKWARGCRTWPTIQSRQPAHPSPPSTPEGIEKYLGSGLIKGIGPQFAHRIVQVFGARTLAIIDESPVFLKEVKGIGPRRISQIRESWRQQKAVRDIMVFLQSHGVGSTRAVRIYKTYGDKAIELVRANPYRWRRTSGVLAFKLPMSWRNGWASTRNRSSVPRQPCVTFSSNSAAPGIAPFPNKG